MKKIISIILILLFAISLCACGDESGSGKIEMPNLEVSAKKDNKDDNKNNKNDEEENSKEDEEPSPEPSYETTPIPCKHMWEEATFFAPKTCTVCGETEGSPVPDYFEANEIPVSELGETSFTLPYIIYYKYDENNFATVKTDAAIRSFGTRSIGNNQKEVFLTFNADLQYTYDKATHIGRSNLTFDIYFFDRYTGQRILIPNTYGDAEVNMTTTLTIEGQSIDVAVVKSISWDRSGDWIYDSNGDGTKTTTLTERLIFTVPEDYEGLILCPAYQTSIPDDTIDTDSPYVIPDALSLKLVDQFDGTDFYTLNPQK